MQLWRHIGQRTRFQRRRCCRSNVLLSLPAVPTCTINCAGSCINSAPVHCCPTQQAPSDWRSGGAGPKCPERHAAARAGQPGSAGTSSCGAASSQGPAMCALNLWMRTSQNGHLCPHTTTLDADRPPLGPASHELRSKIVAASGPLQREGERSRKGGSARKGDKRQSCAIGRRSGG